MWHEIRHKNPCSLADTLHESKKQEFGKDSVGHQDTTDVTEKSYRNFSINKNENANLKRKR